MHPLGPSVSEGDFFLDRFKVVFRSPLPLKIWIGHVALSKVLLLGIKGERGGRDY